MSQYTSLSTIKPFSATSIAKSTTDSTTCPWIDVSGFKEKRVVWEATSAGSIDIDIDMLISPKGAYELNNETTVDTEDYETVNIVTTHTGGVIFSKDGADVDELLRPLKSVKFTIDNDDGTDAVVINLWLEGQSE
jgi:hypothetical protein